MVDPVEFEPTKNTGSTRKGTRSPVYRIFGRQLETWLKPLSSFLITGFFLDRLIVDKLFSSRAFRVQLVQDCS